MKFQKETISPDPLHGRWYDDACAAAFGMEILGERWSMLVMRELTLGARRFSQIRAQLPGISAKVLTQRLIKLEEAGALERQQLPSPANSQVYALTEWGLASEPIMQELGRWAVRSPEHNSRLPLTPVSFMLSLRTMFAPQVAELWEIRVGFDFGVDRFVAHLHDGVLDVVRVDAFEQDPPALIFRAPSPTACLPIFYGKQPLGTPGIPLDHEGDRTLAERFIDLFRLPPKII